LGDFLLGAGTFYENLTNASTPETRPYQLKKLITKVNWPQASLLIYFKCKEPAIIFTTANTDHYIPIRKLSPTHKHYTTDTALNIHCLIIISLSNMSL